MKTETRAKKVTHKSALKKRAIVFGITNNLCFAVGTMLIGFLKHNPDYNGTVLIFHENLSKDQRGKLEVIYPAISFRKFTKEQVETRISNAADRKVIDQLISRYSIFYFAKFELPDLLDEFERVIWLDVDMLVRGPLDEIWDFDEFTWRTAGPASKLSPSFSRLFEAEIKTKDYNRPNGGLIGICRNARKQGSVTTAQLYHWFNELQTRSRSLIADEFSFFLLAATIGANVKELAVSYNCFSTRQGCDTAKIIHAVGAKKFWDSAAMKLAYPDWVLWYNEWVRHGGDTYEGQVAPAGLFITTPNHLVEASLYQDFWRDVFYEIIDRLPPGLIPDIQTQRYFWQIFVQQWPRDQLHIRTSKRGNYFFVALHLEGAAAQDETLVDAIETVFSGTDEFNKVPIKLGFAWEQQMEAADVPEMIIKCAVLAIKIQPQPEKAE